MDGDPELDSILSSFSRGTSSIFSSPSGIRNYQSISSLSKHSREGIGVRSSLRPLKGSSGSVRPTTSMIMSSSQLDGSWLNSQIGDIDSDDFDNDTLADFLPEKAKPKKDLKSITRLPSSGSIVEPVKETESKPEPEEHDSVDLSGLDISDILSNHSSESGTPEDTLPKKQKNTKTNTSTVAKTPNVSDGLSGLSGILSISQDDEKFQHTIDTNRDLSNISQSQKISEITENDTPFSNPVVDLSSTSGSVIVNETISVESDKGDKESQSVSEINSSASGHLEYKKEEESKAESVQSSSFSDENEISSDENAMKFLDTMMQTWNHAEDSNESEHVSDSIDYSSQSHSMSNLEAIIEKESRVKSNSSANSSVAESIPESFVSESSAKTGTIATNVHESDVQTDYSYSHGSVIKTDSDINATTAAATVDATGSIDSFQDTIANQQSTSVEITSQAEDIISSSSFEKEPPVKRKLDFQRSCSMTIRGTNEGRFMEQQRKVILSMPPAKERNFNGSHQSYFQDSQQKLALLGQSISTLLLTRREQVSQRPLQRITLESVREEIKQKIRHRRLDRDNL